MTDIEWADISWNPIRARLRSDPSVIGWHCEHASPGCENCYSETRNRSGRCNMGTKLPYKPGHRKDIEVFLDEAQLLKPLSWRKGKKIFVCSMTDLFADFVTDEMIARIFAVMALCPQHTFQVLTKRSARMRAYLTARKAEPPIMVPIGDGTLEQHPFNNELKVPPNVWLGVSVEDQQRADERIPDLLATPAAVRWISAEPMLGPINIIDAMWARDGSSNIHATIDLVVCGGESGAKARPMHPDWARNLRDQCAVSGTAFFFKQWGEWAPCEVDATGALNPPMPMAGPNLMKWRRWEGAATRPAEPRETVDTWFAPGTFAVPLGKKRAGRLLDGVEHNGMPGQA